MSVLMRGVDMPKNCEECNFKGECRNYWEKIREAYTRPSWCPLVEVADRKTEQTEPRLEQFRVGLEYHTDSVNFGKPKGESITTNKTEPQLAEKCPFDDSLPCEWVCTEYGKCKYRPKDEPQTERSE